MTIKRLKSRLFIIVLFFLLTISYTSAQDLVKDAGQDGLMKTVSYDVARFTDVRDKKLSDVMKKMPGISTSDYSGSLFFMYNGMSIEKIYVNGLDVLEGNFQPVYNLKPEDVEALEMTENHVSIEIMRGKQYSNAASINVVLKESAKGKWSGSIKGMLGATPLLGTTDINVLNLGPSVSTTVMVKADNTGLDFSGPLHGYGDYGSASDTYNEDAYAGLEGVSGGFDYNLRKFLDVEPSLAPLSSERVRFNRSSIAEVGRTYKLSHDYQLNVQLTLHSNRLTANSLDETTYFRGENTDIYYLTDESAKMHQYDIQSSATLLSNTDKQFLRNQLIFNHRRIDMKKDITGTNPNLHDMHTNPIYLKNSFHLKRLVGDHVLSVEMLTGYNTRPQNLDMERNEDNESLVSKQNIKSYSAYMDLGAKYDIIINDNLNFTLNAGGAYNSRNLKTHYLESFSQEQAKPLDENLSILNFYGGASLTYITDKFQGTVGVPMYFGAYDWIGEKDNVFCALPQFELKYDVSSRFSVMGIFNMNQLPMDRKRIHAAAVVQDFKQVQKGYPNISKSNQLESAITATYRNPEHSIFANGKVGYGLYKNPFFPVYEQDGQWVVSAYYPVKGKEGNKELYVINGDISKGISYLKGKIGIAVSYDKQNAKMLMGGEFMPYSYQSYTISPYINGRLASWCNMIYRLDYSTDKMEASYGNKLTHSYKQTMEFIVSPSEKLNFSLLGEHYYTEFSDDLSKHLVLLDLKAEYTLSPRWQLLLSATNILNQDTYNYTLIESESYKRSFTSYSIRPRNILFGVFYKF